MPPPLSTLQGLPIASEISPVMIWPPPTANTSSLTSWPLLTILKTKCPSLSFPAGPNTSQPPGPSPGCLLCGEGDHHLPASAFSSALSHPVAHNSSLTTSQRGPPRRPRQKERSPHLLSSQASFLSFLEQIHVQPGALHSPTWYFSLFCNLLIYHQVLPLDSKLQMEEHHTCLDCDVFYHRRSGKHAGGAQLLLTVERISCIICKMTVLGFSKMLVNDRGRTTENDS